MSPDAIDSVPCCGDPTELPPVEMVDEPVPNNSENVDKDPVTFEEAFDNEIEQVIVQMPEESRAQMRNFFAKINAFEATLGESDLAELDRMKEGIRAQFKAQEAMFMPEGAESELAEEEQETREKGREKMVHFHAVSTLMAQKRKAAVEKRIQSARQHMREIISTPEEREQQDAI